jgi:FkbM family methyltransferase
MTHNRLLPNRPTRHHDIPFKGQGEGKSLIVGVLPGADPYGFKAGETIRLGYARGWAEKCGPVVYVLTEDLAKELEYHNNPAVFLSEYELLGLSMNDCRKLRDVDFFAWVDAHPRSIPELNRRLTVPMYSESETAGLWEARKRVIESEPKFVWNSCGDAAADFFNPWVEDGFRWEKLYQACDSERYYPEPSPEIFGGVQIAYIGRYWQEKEVSFDAYLRKWEDVLHTYGPMVWPYKNFHGPLNEQAERQLYSTAGMIPLVTSPGGHAIAEITERYFKTPGCRCFCISDVNPTLRDVFTEEEMLQAESIEHFHELVADYLAGKIDTQSYADKAYNAIQERHLYSHRAVQINEALSVKSVQKPSSLAYVTAVPVTRARTPEEEVSRWFGDNGDKTLRLDYDLDENSVVFDLGGFEGQWTADIHCMYGCRSYVFEPVVEFAANIKHRFRKNKKVDVFPFGLSDDNKTISLTTNADGSSQFKPGENVVEAQLVKASEFIEEHGIEWIDLMKINIEGGEYDLFDHLIEIGFLTKVRNFQVQFHDWSPDAKHRLAKVQAALKKTHRITYQYNTVWENWEILPGASLTQDINESVAEVSEDRLAVVQRMIDSNTGDSACYIEACRLLLNAGRPDEALRFYEDACELDSANPELQQIDQMLRNAA